VRCDTVSNPLILLGGTFDPVHHGHLRTAVDLFQAFSGRADIALMPAAQHRLREAEAAAPEDRLAMLALAVANEPGLSVEPLEIQRGGTTFTVETLEILRQREGAQRSLIFAMGLDAWHSLSKWHRWLEIVQLAHIIVVCRPQGSSGEALNCGDALQANRTDLIDDLISTSHGKVLFLTLTQLEISSTRIRSLLKQGLSPRYLLPDSVLTYIEKHQLYRCRNRDTDHQHT
jgi:nicotinate-nucleotide adenylyltransferase